MVRSGVGPTLVITRPESGARSGDHYHRPHAAPDEPAADRLVARIEAVLDRIVAADGADEPAAGEEARQRAAAGETLRAIATAYVTAHPEGTLAAFADELAARTVEEGRTRGAGGVERPVSPTAARRAAVPPPGTSTPSEADERLTLALRAWRRERAQHDGVPAYVVFPDATLAALVAARPLDPAALAAVRGFGPSRRQHYGAAILELIRSVR
jgi:superfamily II DNA helicase RecQ